MYSSFSQKFTIPDDSIPRISFDYKEVSRLITTFDYNYDAILHHQ